jgi:hypothetical protein
MRGFDLCRAAMSVVNVTAPEQSVLTALAIMSNDDAQCWPAINGAAGLTGKTKLSERTVQRAVQALKDAGHINWVDKPGRGRVYVVHPRQSDTPNEATPATETPRQPDTRHSDTPVTLTPTPVTVAPNQPVSTIPQKATPSSRVRTTTAKVLHFRLPDDWKPSRFADGTVAREIIDRRGQEWARAALESFRAWAANADDKNGAGRKLDWQAAWVKWVIEQDKRDGRSATNGMAGNRQPSGRTGDGFINAIRESRANREAVPWDADDPGRVPRLASMG